MRSEDLARIQVGDEATGAKGTVVAADRFLPAIEDISPALNLEIGGDGSPKGTKFPAAVVPGREWVENDFEGMADYENLVYLLMGALKRITLPVAGAQTEGVWTFAIDRWVTEDPQTYTVESGDGVTNERKAYVLIPDLTLEFGRDECRVSGRMVGSKFTTGISNLTAAPVEVPLIPILPSQLSVFVDNTAAGIGTTRLLGAMSSRFAISNHWSAVWTQNSQNGRDYSTHIERKPGVELGLTVQKDAIANGLLSDARNGTKKFVRIEAIGGLIGGAVTYKLQIDAAALITGWGDPEDDDGVSVQPVTMRPTFDATLAKAFSFAVTNKRTSTNF